MKMPIAYAYYKLHYTCIMYNSYALDSPKDSSFSIKMRALIDAMIFSDLAMLQTPTGPPPYSFLKVTIMCDYQVPSSSAIWHQPVVDELLIYSTLGLTN